MSASHQMTLKDEAGVDRSCQGHFLETHLMSLMGFTAPFTPTGRSALVPPPPWHFAGQVLSLSFEVAKAPADSLLPDGFGSSTGRAFGHFCEWQATTDGSELVDPAYAQYREFFVLIEAEHRGLGGAVLFCPFIYVDQDISMIRGHLQGWPKKIGSVWMTRSIPGLDHVAAAPMKTGVRFGASLAVKDRRLAETAVTLTGEDAEPIGFLAQPTLGLLAHPSIVGEPNHGAKDVVRAVVTHRVQGPVHGAKLDHLAFTSGPRDEVGLLSPCVLKEANVATFALTVSAAERLEPA